jgi:hypothetical protein
LEGLEETGEETGDGSVSPPRKRLRVPLLRAAWSERVFKKKFKKRFITGI